MQEKKQKYTIPCLIDLGSFEAEGICRNGSIVALCTVGTSYDETQPCALGNAAKTGCSTGTLPWECLSGLFAAEKRQKLDQSKTSRF